MLTLRAHHLLCIQGYRGYGYNKKFTENMDKIIGQLKKDTSIKIKIAAKTDEICSCCPNNTTKKLCQYEFKVQSLDKKVLDLLEINTNEIYTYKFILNTIYERITYDNFKNICSTCQWFGYGYCKEGLSV
ncbi:DUF1284 domain-containing protein [Clostridium sp. WILCCON 0269]|uniref:DUF1284 domain-containing protein n=1 Tax=Candidatus Clostridium eludens TaxID=3381663 RepID=A0ABW8SM89_9CLOT